RRRPGSRSRRRPGRRLPAGGRLRPGGRAGGAAGRGRPDGGAVAGCRTRRRQAAAGGSSRRAPAGGGRGAGGAAGTGLPIDWPRGDRTGRGRPGPSALGSGRSAFGLGEIPLRRGGVGRERPARLGQRGAADPRPAARRQTDEDGEGGEHQQPRVTTACHGGDMYHGALEMSLCRGPPRVWSSNVRVWPDPASEISSGTSTTTTPPGRRRSARRSPTTPRSSSLSPTAAGTPANQAADRRPRRPVGAATIIP